MGNQAPDKVRELLALKQQLVAELHDLDRKIAEVSEQHSGSLGEQSSDVPRRSPRPVRAVVLDALDDLRFPSYTRQLAIYCQARYGRKIAPTRFGSLATDEMKAHRSGKRPRSVWLCFGLTHDRGEPIKRLLARSDWSLEDRIVAPTTGRVQYLKSTVRLCELAAEDQAADHEMMKILAADHARDLPGVEVRRGAFDLERWRDAALIQLQKLERRDAELRAQAATCWEGKLGEAQLLFGAPEVIEGGRDAERARRSWP